jgi:ABC-2 type transport system permease protein
MKTIFFLLQKEFRQIRRNKTILPIIFVLPIVQLLILVHATTFEIKQVNLCMVDQDGSALSQRLVQQIEGSSFFKITASTFSLEQAQQLLDRNKADMIVHIPTNFSRTLMQQKQAPLQLIPNAINANFATLSFNYLTQVVQSFNKNLIVEWSGALSPVPVKQITVQARFWYNPEMNYKWYMYPGIMVILITMIGMFLSGLNLVREKEMGTSEQLNVSPMKKHHFIIGKLLPFLIIGMFELVLATLLGRLVYQVPLVGSVWVLSAFTFIYLLVVLGLGLFISTLAETQQQMMFIAFFILIVFILLSGIFTPTESMPYWVQKFNLINPMSYFMRVLRVVMLKGAGFANLLSEFISLSIYAIIMLSLATWRYRKTA